MKLSPVDLNLLTALDALLQTGSVQRAAAAVGLSKSAMSHALARLRVQLDDPILIRSGQEWLLTDRARSLAPRVRAIVRDSTDVFSPEKPFVAAQLEREFRIHATDHVLSILGVDIGHAIGREAPSVALRFLPILPDDATALRGGAVDLAIGVFPSLPPEFRKQRLFRDRFVVVVRGRMPGVARSLSLEKYLSFKHVLVAPRGQFGSVVDDALAATGKTRRVLRSVPYFLSALDLVSRSDCSVTLSERLARLHARRYDLRIFQPPLPLPAYDIFQVWHPRVDADPAHRWLRKLVARIAKEKVSTVNDARHAPS